MKDQVFPTLEENMNFHRIFLAAARHAWESGSRDGSKRENRPLWTVGVHFYYATHNRKQEVNMEDFINHMIKIHESI